MPMPSQWWVSLWERQNVLSFLWTPYITGFLATSQQCWINRIRLTFWPLASYGDITIHYCQHCPAIFWAPFAIVVTFVGILVFMSDDTVFSHHNHNGKGWIKAIKGLNEYLPSTDECAIGSSGGELVAEASILLRRLIKDQNPRQSTKQHRTFAHGFHSW